VVVLTDSCLTLLLVTSPLIRDIGPNLDMYGVSVQGIILLRKQVSDTSLCERHNIWLAGYWYYDISLAGYWYYDISLAGYWLTCL